MRIVPSNAGGRGHIAVSSQFAALDIEATGMDPTRDEIIEVAVVIFSRDEEIERFDSIVRPFGRLSLDLSHLTGIQADRLKGAPGFRELGPTIRRLLAGRPIVGHSVELDAAMLAAAGISLSNPIYDTYRLATLLIPDLPVYSLAAVAAHLGVPSGADHRALSDALVGAGVFRALLDRIEALDPDTLDRVALLGQTAGWPFAELFRAAANRRPSGPLFDLGEEGRRGPHELNFLVPREKPEPLRRTNSTKALGEQDVVKSLAPHGSISRVVEGYEHRRSQEQMARAIARTFNGNGRLLVEAGTGTGKSVAYLLPAVLHATERGETVVVSTNTLALQDQLIRKDIPDLRRALRGTDEDEPFEAAVLKGRANYLCLRRWFASQRQPVVSSDEAQLRAKILLWLGSTDSGDRAELRLTPDEEAQFRHLSAEGEACAASRCVFQQRNQCFLFRARRQAEHAHLVVVNHALLLSDTVEGGRVLPEYEHLIVDEAHHLEEQATTQFGFSAGEPTILDLIDGIVRPDGALLVGQAQDVLTYLGRTATDEASQRQAAVALERSRALLGRSLAAKSATADFFGRLRDLIDHRRDDFGGYDRTLRIIEGTRRDAVWVQVEIAWERLEVELRAIERDLEWMLEAVEKTSGTRNTQDDEAIREDLAVELTAALRASADLRANLGRVIANPSADDVYWVERSTTSAQIVVHAAPLHVGLQLRERLFDPLRTAVLTSATLTTDGTFDYMRDRLGLEDADELAVASPFDYERSTLLYLTDDIPEPNLPGYQRGVEAALIALGEAMGGRILVLFTSHAALQATSKAIRRPLEDGGVIVLAQRTDGSPRQLIERFKRSSNVVLLGTSTFWEGVDVVGPALSALVIAKLPFAVPSDPVFSARSESFDEPFVDYAVPQAVLKFKQGFGRLIRSSHDRGVCAVFDRRVVSKRYGASFIQSLPSCSVTVGSATDLPFAATEWLAPRR